MTPENPYDVISDIRSFIEDIARFPNDDTFRFETDRAGAKAILAAIQVAENEALERAASWHDEQSVLFKRRTVETLSLICPSEDVACAQDQMSDFYRDCAKAVRALKHKDVK